MKIRAMIEQDLLDVAKIHKEAFSRYPCGENA